MPTDSTTANYIEFKYSDSSGAKKFAVVQGTLKPVPHKNQTVRRTPEGRLDVTEGPHTTTWGLTVRCHNVPTGADLRGSDFGTLPDLRAFFAKKNPRATPSNSLILVDHLGNSHTVYLVGDLPEDNITAWLDGDASVYFIPLVLEEV